VLAITVMLTLVPAPVLAASAGHKHHNRRHQAKPRVFWNLPGRVSEDQAIPFTWKVKGRFGPKLRLVVQRPVGTARVWRAMLRLRGRKGSAELPGQTLGKYRFRLALLRGHRVIAKRVAGIGVFGQVPFSTLFRNNDDDGVYAMPSGSFPYVNSWYSVGDSDYEEPPTTLFSVEHNHCSAVHFGFVFGGDLALVPHIIGTATLVQQTRDPASASVPFNTLGAIDVQLVPGQTWSVLASYAGEGEIPTVYYNGYAICSSTESFFS
jgi:hypothetical protein